MVRMQVKREERSNGYCGPAALSLLTGVHVDDCVAALRAGRQGWRLSKRVSIRGVHSYELLKILKSWGYGYDRVPLPTRFAHRGASMYPTMAGFLRFTKKRTPDQMFLVSTKSHFLVVRGKKIYDNRFLFGVFVRQYPKRRSRVIAAWEIKKP